METLISTTSPYENLWIKRGSKYLSTGEFVEVTSELWLRQIIQCEVKERVGSKIPYLCTEDLSFVIVTETNTTEYNELKPDTSRPTESNTYKDEICDPDYKPGGNTPDVPDVPDKPDTPVDPTPDTPVIHHYDLIEHMDDNHTDEEQDCPWEIIDHDDFEGEDNISHWETLL